ncbi:MAG: SsrA-binding protein SmpB [Clostridia bacterium]|nr:SsrA-binding protein SmpB [Clostridia bacterium]
MDKIIAENRKALHDYFVEDKFEAGIVLEGSEVKSVRAGKVNLKDSFAIVKGGELFLVGTNISTYAKTTMLAPNPTRTRKLLLHKEELSKIERKTKIKGYTLIPLDMHFKAGLIKVQIGLCRGKQEFDKKQSLKEKDIKREMEREFKDN